MARIVGDPPASIRVISAIPFGSAQGLSLSNGRGQEFCDLKIVAEVHDADG